MPIHVSLHDVSPAFEDETEEALEICHAHGVRPALLVVPNYHARASLGDHPRFVERLRRLRAEGHEIYLHGYFHKSRMDARDAAQVGKAVGNQGRPGRVAWLFAQKVASGGEAEFSDVSHEEAISRLDDGERMLRDAGLPIDGFVAPAWSMPAWLLPMLSERRYAYTEDHLRVYAPDCGASRASVVLNWASRTPERVLSTTLYCRLARHARALAPTRIAIHPKDLHLLLLRREIDRMLRWAEGDVVARGRDLLGARAA
jgi:predicted deacetylase